MLLAGHVPGRGKPFLKRNPAAVEDGSCRDGYFAAAARASESAHLLFANPFLAHTLDSESRLAIATAPDTNRSRYAAQACRSANQE
jgi:hypothetical protein